MAPLHDLVHPVFAAGQVYASEVARDDWSGDDGEQTRDQTGLRLGWSSFSGRSTPGGGMPVQGNSGGTDQSPGLLKLTLAPENPAAEKLTIPAENLMWSKSTWPPENWA